LVKSSEGLFVDLEPLVEFAKGGIVSKTLLETPQSEIDIFCIFSWQSLSGHTSRFLAVIHVLSGKATVSLGKNIHSAKTNSWFYLPAHLPHSVKAEEDLVFLLTLFK